MKNILNTLSIDWKDLNSLLIEEIQIFYEFIIDSCKQLNKMVNELTLEDLRNLHQKMLS